MNILLVDDHAVVRQGYKSLINVMMPEFTVLQAADGPEAKRILREQQVDLMILDINLGHESGLVLSQQFFDINKQLKIIFFSMFEDGAILHRAMESNAMGYISKQSDPEVLISAIRIVLKGQKYIEQPLAMKLAKQLLNEQMDIQSRLTLREFEVFIAFAMKKSRQQAAQDLGVTVKTISNTLTVIKRKLGIEVNEFRALAAQHGYIGTT